MSTVNNGYFAALDECDEGDSTSNVLESRLKVKPLSIKTVHLVRVKFHFTIEDKRFTVLSVFFMKLATSNEEGLKIL